MKAEIKYKKLGWENKRPSLSLPRSLLLVKRKISISSLFSDPSTPLIIFVQSLTCIHTLHDFHLYLNKETNYFFCSCLAD